MNSFRKGCNNNLKNCNSANLEKRIMVIFGMEAIGKRIDSIGENFSAIIQSIVKYDELADLHSEVWGYSDNS